MDTKRPAPGARPQKLTAECAARAPGTASWPKRQSDFHRTAGVAKEPHALREIIDSQRNSPNEEVYDSGRPVFYPAANRVEQALPGVTAKRCSPGNRYRYPRNLLGIRLALDVDDATCREGNWPGEWNVDGQAAL